MKKVGIVTITSGMNYGNSLQNLAIILFLKKLGVEGETILNLKKCSHIEPSIKARVKSYLKILLNYKNEGLKEKFDLTRQKKYLEFDRKHIPFSHLFFCGNNAPESLDTEYDYFITGSDIVWNPFYCNDIMFLSFAKSSKRISYAASFGLKEIPYNCVEKYKIGLGGMSKISVRELAGMKIVNEISKSKAEVHVDPTLLIDVYKWEEIAKRPDWYNEKRYMLTYFLGEMPSLVKNEVEKLARENDFEIINLLDLKNEKWYSVDPCEFLFLIKKANLIYTDSFHGAVFSVLFKRPFVACERFEKEAAFCNLSSRLENLLKMFSLKDRLGTVNNQYTVENPLEIDFSTVEEVLNIERKRAEDYLIDAMSIDVKKDMSI